MNNEMINEGSPHIKEGIETVDREKGRLIQKNEIIRVLDRASRDMRFGCALMEKGSEALSEYGLTSEAKAAIISGDLNWILNNTGDLKEEQLQWIRSRLEMERW